MSVGEFYVNRITPTSMLPKPALEHVRILAARRDAIRSSPRLLVEDGHKEQVGVLHVAGAARIAQTLGQEHPGERVIARVP